MLIVSPCNTFLHGIGMALNCTKFKMALFGLHFANNGLMDDEKSEATVF